MSHLGTLEAGNRHDLHVGISPDAPDESQLHDDAEGAFGYAHSYETASRCDGPGLRVVLFVSGCLLRCSYCHNPDTWHLKDGSYMSIEQVLAWAPDTIITWDPHFYAGYASDPVWAAVPAVQAKRVFLAPRLPFGWIDAPPSINRIVGLRWIAGLLYPDKFPEDIRGVARDFIKLFYQVDVSDAALDRILAGAQPGGSGR